MRTAIATVAIRDESGGPEWLDVALPNLAAYAERIGAAFLCVERSAEFERGLWTMFYAKVNAYEAVYSLGFDRVAYIDADCLVANDAPSIFETLPAGIIHARQDVDETRDHFVAWARKRGHSVPEDFRHHNAGVLVMDARDMNGVAEFTRANVVGDYMGEQNNLNLWNHYNPGRIETMGNEWNDFADPDVRPDSFIYHFVSPQKKSGLAFWAGHERFRT